jgi:hypothetical protein
LTCTRRCPDPLYPKGMVLGTASGGILLTLLRAVAKEALPADDAGLRGGAALLLAAAGAVQLLALAGYHWLVAPAVAAVEQDAEG